jgi:alpha-methylacyl-CoA racemase
MEEAPNHPHNVARQSFVTVGGGVQPAPTPRFSRTPSATPQPIKDVGADTKEVLADFGFEPSEVESLIERRVVAVA